MSPDETGGVAVACGFKSVGSHLTSRTTTCHACVQHTCLECYGGSSAVVLALGTLLLESSLLILVSALLSLVGDSSYYDTTIIVCTNVVCLCSYFRTTALPQDPLRWQKL